MIDGISFYFACNACAARITERVMQSETRIHPMGLVASRDGFVFERNGDELLLIGSLREEGVYLTFNKKQMSAHQIVYEAFVGPVPKKDDEGHALCLTHLDWDNTNNAIDNLCVKTKSQLSEDNACFRNNWAVIATNLATKEERRFANRLQASRELGINRKTIAKICDGRAGFGKRTTVDGTVECFKFRYG